MLTKPQLIPIAGLLATIAAAGYMVTRTHAQNAVQPVDLRTAMSAELLDSQGRAVLRGSFDDDDDTEDIERKATLTASDSGVTASGVAEVEFARQAPVDQEVEFSGERLQPNASYRLIIDGREVLTGVAERDGDLELERKIPIPGGAGGR